MEIKLNGKDKIYNKDLTISCIIKLEATPRDGLVVMVNEDIIPREDWDNHSISTDDEVEMLCFVSGG